MADLNHLLDELEEQPLDSYDDDDPKEAGRPSVATAATEPLTADDWDEGAETPRRFVAIPAALQDAKRRQQQPEMSLEGEEEKELDYFAEGGSAQEQVNEVYTQMHQMWHEERHSPEILPYNRELVEEIQKSVEERQEWIDSTLEDMGNAQLDPEETSVQKILVTLAQVDLDRIKYVLTNWMAERLAKIEAHPIHMVKQVDRLSDIEVEYLKEYGALVEDHLRSTVLDNFVEAWQSIDEPNMIDQPNYDSYHFWMVNEPFEADEVEQDEGTCLVAKYSAMRDHLKEGKVELRL